MGLRSFRGSQKNRQSLAGRVALAYSLGNIQLDDYKESLRSSNALRIQAVRGEKKDQSVFKMGTRFQELIGVG